MSNKEYSVKIYLTFSAAILEESVVCQVAKLYDIEFNIIKASIAENSVGYIILDLHGKKEECDKAIQYLSDRGVGVSPVAQRIWHDEEKCIDCGACTALCPSKALYMDSNNHLCFDKSKCVVCLKCTNICPVHALKGDVDLIAH